jgi:hypothetical protein
MIQFKPGTPYTTPAPDWDAILAERPHLHPPGVDQARLDLMGLQLWRAWQAAILAAHKAAQKAK